jgi:hypothetical protein
MLRNILCHAPVSEQRKVLEAYPSKLARFHSESRISTALTKTYGSPKPGQGSKARGAPAAARPRAQMLPQSGPARSMSLHLGKRVGHAAVTHARYVGRM